MSNSLQKAVISVPPKFKELENLGQKFQDENFLKPNDDFVSETIETIQKQKLLVLAGGNKTDKTILVQYLAWYFSNQFDNGKKPSVKEWQPSFEPQSIERKLFKQKKPTVYLFTQVSRQNFNSDLSKIYQAIKKTNHYVIITTEESRENWDVSEQQEFWKDLDSLPYELYSSTKMTHQKTLSGIEAEGNIDVEDIKQIAKSGNSKEQEAATNLKTKQNIKIGNITQEG